jgi:hypothetical protein
VPLLHLLRLLSTPPPCAPAAEPSRAPTRLRLRSSSRTPAPGHGGATRSVDRVGAPADALPRIGVGGPPFLPRRPRHPRPEGVRAQRWSAPPQGEAGGGPTGSGHRCAPCSWSSARHVCSAPLLGLDLPPGRSGARAAPSPSCCHRASPRHRHHPVRPLLRGPPAGGGDEVAGWEWGRGMRRERGRTGGGKKERETESMTSGSHASKTAEGGKPHGFGRWGALNT